MKYLCSKSRVKKKSFHRNFLLYDFYWLNKRNSNIGEIFLVMQMTFFIYLFFFTNKKTENILGWNIKFSVLKIYQSEITEVDHCKLNLSTQVLNYIKDPTCVGLLPVLVNFSKYQSLENSIFIAKYQNFNFKFDIFCYLQYN